jgi:hypothetical protein
MPYTPEPFNTNTQYPGQVKNELNLANTNFTVLGQAFFNNDPTQPILRATYIDTTAPTNPVSGSTWLDTSSNPPVLKVYDGNDWQVASSGGGSSSNTGSGEIISPLSIPYSKLYIQNTAPDNPTLYDSWYNTDDNKLKYYNGNDWIEFDWTKYVEGDIWYKMGRLRINEGRLEISNAYDEWYQIYPTIGRVVEVDPNDKIVFLTVGQSLLGYDKSKVNLAVINVSLWKGYCVAKPIWQGTMSVSDLILGLTSNEYSPTGSIKVFSDYSLLNTYEVNFLPISDITSIGRGINKLEFTINFYDNIITTNSTNVIQDNTLITTSGKANVFSNGYYFDSFYHHLYSDDWQTNNANYEPATIYFYSITRVV